MDTLPQIMLDFNRKIKLFNDGCALPSDTGLFLFREFDKELKFSQKLTTHLHVNDEQTYFIHSNEKLLRQKIFQMIAEYSEDYVVYQ